jgi:photosystem II stability/assembly factor-like uncharacterized protein
MSDQSAPTEVYVGTAQAGEGSIGGVFRRTAGDGAWRQLGGGLPIDCNVYAITLHPSDPRTVFIGTNDGVWRSGDGGDHWERAGWPDRGVAVWSVLVHPADPRVLYAGGSPVAVYRSEDGGDSWRRLPAPAVPGRVTMPFACRVMRLAADPERPQELYAALEVNGAMRSRDGGESWQDCSAELIRLAERPHLQSRLLSDTEAEGMLDAHALALSAAAPGTVFLALRMGLFRSADRGEGWDDMEVGRFSPLTYARDVRVAPQDPRVLYACLSPASRSTDGSVWRSDDLGGSWRRFDRGISPRSTMMAVAPHPRDPRQVWAAAREGQVFGTTDGGATWQEHPLPAECRDVYAIACG